MRCDIIIYIERKSGGGLCRFMSSARDGFECINVKQAGVL